MNPQEFQRWRLLFEECLLVASAQPRDLPRAELNRLAVDARKRIRNSKTDEWVSKYAEYFQMEADNSKERAGRKPTLLKARWLLLFLVRKHQNIGKGENAYHARLPLFYYFSNQKPGGFKNVEDMHRDHRLWPIPPPNVFSYLDTWSKSTLDRKKDVPFDLGHIPSNLPPLDEPQVYTPEKGSLLNNWLKHIAKDQWYGIFNDVCNEPSVFRLDEAMTLRRKIDAEISSISLMKSLDLEANIPMRQFEDEIKKLAQF